MDKFGRKYKLDVELKGGGTLTIEPPFTIEFDIMRNIFSSANFSTIRILNLSANNRNKIRKDVSDYLDLRAIELKAGYGSNLPVIFSGNVSQAWSVREGTNFITQIESFDGGFAFANGITSETFPANTAQATVIETLLKALPGVTVGAVGEYPGSLSRGNSYVGNTCDLLRELTGGGFFIDNRKANCLGNNEYLDGEIQVINAQAGLLGTPIREQSILHFSMLFEPKLIVGQKVRLESQTDVNFNGEYKVISVEHRGTISEAVCGDATTLVGLFFGTEALQGVEII